MGSRFPSDTTLFDTGAISPELEKIDVFYLEALETLETSEDPTERTYALCDVEFAEAYQATLLALASGETIVERYPHNELEIQDVPRCTSASEFRSALIRILEAEGYEWYRSSASDENRFALATMEREDGDIAFAFFVEWTQLEKQNLGPLTMRFDLKRAPGSFKRKRITDPADPAVKSLRDRLDPLLGELATSVERDCE